MEKSDFPRDAHAWATGDPMSRKVVDDDDLILYQIVLETISICLDDLALGLTLEVRARHQNMGLKRTYKS